MISKVWYSGCLNSVPTDFQISCLFQEYSQSLVTGVQYQIFKGLLKVLKNLPSVWKQIPQ